MTSAVYHTPAGRTDQLPDGDWSVDPQRSEVGFAVQGFWGLQTVHGTFGACDGSLQIRAGAATGELRIDAAGLDTGHERRDRHLRSPDFFDVERYPEIVFTVAAVTARDGGPTVTGELVIGSSRLRLRIPVNLEQTADGALRLEGQTTVSRKAAGIDWNMLRTIGDDATLDARLTLERATS